MDNQGFNSFFEMSQMFQIGAKLLMLDRDAAEKRQL